MHALGWLFVAAFLLYSVVIWRHWWTKEFRSWMIPVFGAALMTDIFVTIFYCVLMQRGFKWSSHAVAGIICLAVMAIHFLWALDARVYKGRAERYFKRCSIYAWSFWIAATLSGFFV